MLIKIWSNLEKETPEEEVKDDGHVQQVDLRYPVVTENVFFKVKSIKTTHQDRFEYF